MSKHISRNRAATIKASQKTAHEKIAIFFLQKMVAPSKKVIALNLYIGTNVLVYERWLVPKVWYTVSRPSCRPNAFAIT